MTIRLEVLDSGDVPVPDLAELRQLWAAAFGPGFTSVDADHAFGGVHVVMRDGDRIISHACAVPRTILVGEQPFAAGYVEAVATLPTRQRHGLGADVMRRLDAEIRGRFELGVLSTGSATAFYQRLGWERWGGPSYVICKDGRCRTADEDDGLMALRFGASTGIDLSAPIACFDRPGDAW